MTDDRAADLILTQCAFRTDIWRVCDGRDGHYRDATEEEAATLDRVRLTLGPVYAP